VLGLPPGVHSYALLPIGYPMGLFGPVRRVPLADVVYEDRSGQTYGAAPSGRVVCLLISPFSSAMTLIERYRPVTTQRFALSSNSWPCGHLTPRPAMTQRLVLSSNSLARRKAHRRPVETQRFVLSS